MTLNQGVFALGEMVLAGVAFGVPRWRDQTLVSLLFFLPSFIGAATILVESPRSSWLELELVLGFLFIYFLLSSFPRFLQLWAAPNTPRAVRFPEGAVLGDRPKHMLPERGGAKRPNKWRIGGRSPGMCFRVTAHRHSTPSHRTHSFSSRLP